MKSSYQIGIIGAGFGGMTAALRLKESGENDFVIFERAEDLGGTWRDNQYPGCACDVPSHLYSFRNAPNPNWSEAFSTQPEIWKYMKQVAQQNRLQEHIVYNAQIVSSVFKEETGRWQLTDKTGRTFDVKMLIAAIGPLNRPNIPPLKGLDTFRGTVFHSSQWDNSCNLEGKKVAVIGTGASAIQIVPTIAPIVKDLTLFQRTPAWISPRRNRKYLGLEKTLFKYLPFLQKLNRERIYWISEFLGLNFLGNKLMNRLGTLQALSKLKKEVKDPEIRKKLTPNYTFGCKRILLSDDYLPSFNRVNVHLVTEPIDHIEADGIVGKDGQKHEAEVIIFGTGFHAAGTDGFDMEVIGLKQCNLVKEWQQSGIQGFKGITVSGFPNLTFILGPNTGLGHTSVLHIMDSQMNYIIDYLHLLQKQGTKGYLDVQEQIQRVYNEQLQSQFAGTVWASGCQSWYLDAHGRNTTIYPGLTQTYRKATQHIDQKDYETVKGISGK